MKASTSVSSSQYEPIFGNFENEEMKTFKFGSNKKAIVTTTVYQGLLGFLLHLFGNAIELQVNIPSATGLPEKKWVYIPVNEVCRELKIDVPPWYARAANSIGPEFRKLLRENLRPAPFLHVVPTPPSLQRSSPESPRGAASPREAVSPKQLRNTVRLYDSMPNLHKKK